MKISIFIDAPPSFFCSWLEDFTRDAPYQSLPTEKGYITLQTARPSNMGNSLYMNMDGIYVINKGDTAEGYPLSSVIRFKIIPLTPSRIEIVADCNQLVAQDYFLHILIEIIERWPQSENVQAQLSNIKTKIEAGFADIKRGQAAIYSLIGEIDRKSLDQIREAVQQGRIEQGEISRALDAVRRVLRFILNEDTKFNKEVVEQAKKIEDAVNSEISLQQKLELTIPILPLFLYYKVELSAGNKIDMEDLYSEAQQRWQALIAQAKK